MGLSLFPPKKPAPPPPKLGQRDVPPTPVELDSHALSDIPITSDQRWVTHGEPCTWESFNKEGYRHLTKWLIDNHKSFYRTGSAFFYEKLVEKSSKPVYVDKEPEDYDFILEWNDIPESIRPPAKEELDPESWGDTEYHLAGGGSSPKAAWRNLCSVKLEREVEWLHYGPRVYGMLRESHRRRRKIVLNFIICLTEVEFVTFRTATEMFLRWMDAVEKPQFTKSKEYRVGFFEGVRTFMFATLRDDL